MLIIYRLIVLYASFYLFCILYIIYIVILFTYFRNLDIFGRKLVIWVAVSTLEC